jgi:hypothetical protein
MSRAALLCCTALALVLGASVAQSAEVPPQYRGLWCTNDGKWHTRCRGRDFEIRRDSITFIEDGPCRMGKVTPLKDGHRIGLHCPKSDSGFGESLIAIKLRFDRRGRLHDDLEARPK